MAFKTVGDHGRLLYNTLGGDAYDCPCSVIIIDDVMYANIIPEDLPLFYRAVSFLNEERSLIIITNRELSGWISAAEDTHLMQTLVDRITANSQIIRL